MIIGLTGSFCAGKDVVAEYLQKKQGFSHISLSDLIREELREKKIPIIRKNLQDYANEKRASEGHSYFADKALKRIESNKRYIVTSIRHPEEVRALEKGQDFFLIFVDAPLQLRFKRMRARKDRKENDAKTLKEFKANEAKENKKGGPGQQLGQCRKMAKIVLKNDKSLDVLYAKVDRLVQDLCIRIALDSRPSKEDYYLRIAEQVAARSNCLSMKTGTIIIKDDQIVATGYNGAPRKTRDCIERGFCLRRKMGIPSGHRYELCRTVHGEANSIINAARSGASVLDSDMYMYGIKVLDGQTKVIDAYPCFICKKMIINAGIKRFIARQADGGIKIFDVKKDWVEGWRKGDMTDDMDLYDSKYGEKC
ncbi:MAG: AAA family ATPase [Nanoarchaeota archaeon]|nr:AAA family ATPase [Nanoarchaeota archaeon]